MQSVCIELSTIYIEITLRRQRICCWPNDVRNLLTETCNLGGHGLSLQTIILIQTELNRLYKAATPKIFPTSLLGLKSSTKDKRKALDYNSQLYAQEPQEPFVRNNILFR